MIKFFRHIRQKLLVNNQMKKYVLYAIGEIALVMIGILLALQVNTWNEERKEKDLEHSYLLALHEEFKNNLEILERVIARNKRGMENAQKLAKHTGPGVPTLSEAELGKLFFGTINSEVQYRPGSGVVNEIISSGKLSIFRNAKLKNALASLDGLLLNVRYQEKEELGSARQNIISLVQHSNISSRRMVADADIGSFDVDRGKFTNSSLPLLKSIPFDNLLTQFIFTSGFMEYRYGLLKSEIENIINIIESQLNS